MFKYEEKLFYGLQNCEHVNSDARFSAKSFKCYGNPRLGKTLGDIHVRDFLPNPSHVKETQGLERH